ncbi:proteasome endopeptidase complex, archaeal, alpha subunit [Candidatus Woesearchaeota archaeon]|nr:archaeal proteasome endopeptidase complex subunit alpha [Candidatus Woesearchaeota archaeon]RLE43066.1 MAG: proteasome endopeptidase complex, archaeal, alpha subunit [Candidatus Woesearchaeota archaeon]
MKEDMHQAMGYDRAITMFSPDGRLLQVEYAKKTVRQGSTAIGIVTKEGVVFIADKRIVDTLVVPESVEKIFEIDEHIGATASGIISDARVLIEEARVKAQQHRITYDSKIDILSIVKRIADIKQVFTQSGGLRPFGVSLLIGGVDSDKPVLYETDPTGIYFEYKASVIGEGETIIEDFLHKHYKPSLTLREGFELGLKALAKLFETTEWDLKRIDGAYISVKEQKFKKFSPEEIKKTVSKILKK